MTAVVSGELEVCTVSGEDPHRATRLPEDEHYLGSARWSALWFRPSIIRGAGWRCRSGCAGRPETRRPRRGHRLTDSQRAERIGLIVQNRRFLVPGKTRMPNPASHALGLAVNSLPATWVQAHGYRPLLAETFTYIEQFEGTCCEAAGVGSRDASPTAHPRTPRRFPLPLLPPRPELLRSLQPAS